MSRSSFNSKEFGINPSNIASFEAGVGVRKFREKNYQQLLEERDKRTNKISQQKIEPTALVSQENRREINKAFWKLFALGNIPFALNFLTGCAYREPVVIEDFAEEQQQEEEIKNNEVAIDSPGAKKETKSVEEEVVGKVDVPEIKGQTFNLTFNQEDKTYLNEAGKVVGALVEDAVKIEGKLSPAIVLDAETLNKILAENKEKGIFKCPWPFDWQKDKDMEIVELFWTSSYQQEIYEKHGIYLSSFIAIKFTKPINFYSPFDVNDEIPGNVNEVFPDKKEDPNFASVQGYKNLGLTSAFYYESEEIEGKRYGSIQFNFIDWQPLITLGEFYELGNEGYGQDILGKIKAGTLLGKILPNTADLDFLDFADNPKFHKNPGQFQGNLIVYDFQDDFTQSTSSLEKMLNYKNKAGQEIPVGIWLEENTAHEQNN